MYKVVISVCLSVCFSDHNSGTPGPIASDFDWGTRDSKLSGSTLTFNFNFNFNFCNLGSAGFPGFKIFLCGFLKFMKIEFI